MKKRVMMLFAVLFAWLCVLPASAGNLPVLPTDTAVPAAGCVFLGIEGEYITETQKALERMNEIRKEACREGVPNPDTGRPLTMDDYIPIKWSSDLEYIARIRAAESSVTEFHRRLNGKPWYDMEGPHGGSGNAEVIAWNFRRSMVEGIDQWYEEKEAWVKQDPYEVTGHYTSMISPSNRYVGLGTFYSKLTRFPNTTLGQFSSAPVMDETQGNAVAGCVQILEVSIENIVSGSCGVTGDVPKKAGETGALKMTVSATGNYGPVAGLQVLGNVRWTSSNPSAASVDANGIVTARGCGNVDITATAENGVSAKRSFSLEHNWDDGVITKEPSVSASGTKTFTCKSCKAVRTEKVAAIRLKKGRTYPVGAYKYKVTNASQNGKGTVTLIGTTMKKSALTSLKVAGTVKIGGVKFKVTAIENRAFRGCKKLTSVTIGKNVKTIGTEAFKNCKRLNTITIKSRSLTRIGKDAIRNIDKKAVIRVPSGKRTAYKKLLLGNTGYQKKMKIR